MQAAHDIFIQNIPTKTTESREEAEKELHRFFDEVLSQTGITRRGVYKIHIPRHCNRRLQTYFAFMQLEDPDEHEIVIERCQDIRYQTHALGLSWARTPINPLNCRAVRERQHSVHSEDMRKERRRAHSEVSESMKSSVCSLVPKRQDLPADQESLKGWRVEKRN